MPIDGTPPNASPAPAVKSNTRKSAVDGRYVAYVRKSQSLAYQRHCHTQTETAITEDKDPTSERRSLVGLLREDLRPQLADFRWGPISTHLAVLRSDEIGDAYVQIADYDFPRTASHHDGLTPTGRPQPSRHARRGECRRRRTEWMICPITFGRRGPHHASVGRARKAAPLLDLLHSGPSPRNGPPRPAAPEAGRIDFDAPVPRNHAWPGSTTRPASLVER